MATRYGGFSSHAGDKHTYINTYTCRYVQFHSRKFVRLEAMCLQILLLLFVGIAPLFSFIHTHTHEWLRSRAAGLESQLTVVCTPEKTLCVSLKRRKNTRAIDSLSFKRDENVQKRNRNLSLCPKRKNFSYLARIFRLLSYKRRGAQ